MWLFDNFAQEADAGDECATVVLAKPEKGTRVDVAIDYLSILMIGHIIEAAANSPVHLGKVEAFLEIGSEIEVGRKAPGVRRSDYLLVLIDDGKWKAAAPVQSIGEVQSFEMRHRSPGVGDSAIRSVPGQRTVVEVEK